MPNYRYQCEDCCEEFTSRRRIADRDEPVTCPECGKETTNRLLGQFNVGSASSGGTSG